MNTENLSRANKNRYSREAKQKALEAINKCIEYGIAKSHRPKIEINNTRIYVSEDSMRVLLTLEIAKLNKEIEELDKEFAEL